MRCVLNRFLKGTCALAFVLFALGSAKAADDFKGFYVGVNAGGAFGRPRVDTSPTFSSTGYFAATSTPAITNASNQTIDMNGFTAGGTAGYNFQFESVVVGLEADYGSMNLSGVLPDNLFYGDADRKNELGIYSSSARRRGFWSLSALWDRGRCHHQREIHWVVY
jgi:hypothetical protein